MQTDLFQHFVPHGHNVFLEDCTITLIDKTDGVDPTRRGEYRRRVMKTVSLYRWNTAAQKFHILARLLHIFRDKSVINVKCFTYYYCLFGRTFRCN